MDLPGVGRSDPPPAAPAHPYVAFAGDVAQLADALDLRSFAVVRPARRAPPQTQAA